MHTRISLRYELYRGLHTRIAKRLGVSRSFVWRVANGERRSTKVETALIKELARLQAKADKALALADVIATVMREARRSPSSRERARSNS
jgi:transcriptional regulator with XRE-family HTH domain